MILCQLRGERCVRFRIYSYRPFAIDNFKIEDKGSTPVRMHELLKITGPELTNCLFPDNPAISIQYRYTHKQPCGDVVTDIPIRLEITDPDGTVHTFDESITKAGGFTGNGSGEYTFTNSVPMQDIGDYVITCSFIDPQVGHETVALSKTIHIDRPIVNSFPYEEDFNTNDGEVGTLQIMPPLPMVSCRLLF